MFITSSDGINPIAACKLSYTRWRLPDFVIRIYTVGFLIPNGAKSINPYLIPKTQSLTPKSNMRKTLPSIVICIALAGLLASAACQSDNIYDTIPYVLVDTTINLNNLQYEKLRQDKGYVEILGGYKGIIIYRESANNYKAFEKASPYRTDEACGEIFVDQSRLYMYEGCNNSVFDFNGYPAGGVANIPLRQYATALDGNYLHIFSDF